MVHLIINNETCTFLKIKNVTKLIDNKILFQNVNFELKQGDICCLYGNNGVGKSTLIDCMLGFQPIDDGEIEIYEKKINNRVYLRQITGIVSIHHQEHMENLTPKEYFNLIIDIYKLEKRNVLHQLNELIQKLNIENFLKTIFKELSFGTKKKVHLIGNLIFEPKLLVCDEIFEGLDENSIKAVKEIFLERAKKLQTTFFTTHITHEAEEIITKRLLLKDKQIIEIGDLNDLHHIQKIN